MLQFEASLMHGWIYLYVYILLTVVKICTGISSPFRPFATYKHSITLQANVADLWWTVDDTKQEITFELHMKTTGWIALGISSGSKLDR